MPEKIQNYTVSDRIGTGGTGIVRRGRENDTKADVAVKTLNTEFVREPHVRKRLKDTKKKLQSLPKQENVVRVLDIVESGDTMHVVMEYAPGRSLETLLSKKSRPMPHESAVQLLNQALRGVLTAHSKGVLHGNLKPSDIIIAGDNTVKVSGFGIAPSLSNAALMRSAGRTGKIAYMPPEQVRGESLDERSDVYSLGVILYRLITGSLPYSVNERDSEARLRQAVLQQQAPDIATAMPELNIPPHLANLVKRALSKDRKDRIPSTREFARLLQKIQPNISDQNKSEQKKAEQKNSSDSARVALSGSALAAVGRAAMQFPPPQAPPLSVQPTIQPLAQAPSQSAPLSESEIASAKIGLEAPQNLTPANNQSVENAQEQSQEKKGFASLFSKSAEPAPPAQDAPTVFSAPTLAKTQMQIEVERRMQAVKAEQERAAQAAQMPAIEGNTAPTAEQPFGRQTDSALFAGDTSSGTVRPLSPEELKSKLAESTVSSAFSDKSPRMAADKSAQTGATSESASQKEDKKKRSVLPWLVVGAVALGGGIYYVALKNKAPESAAKAGRELSAEEQERQRDSITKAVQEAAEQNSSEPSTSQQEQPQQSPPEQNSSQQDATQENPASQNPSASIESGTGTGNEIGANQSANSTKNLASDEKPRIPSSSDESASATSKNPSKQAQSDAQPTKIKPSQSEARNGEQSPKAEAKNARLSVENTSTQKPTERTQSSVAASFKQESVAKNSTKPQKQQSGPARNEALPQETSTKATSSKETSTKETSSKKIASSTRNEAKPKAFAQASEMSKTSETPKSSDATQSKPKSGSLAEANAASTAEKEAARERIRKQYADHLKRKNSSTKSGSVAANTQPANASSSANDAPSGKESSNKESSGKAVPEALNSSRAAKMPRTNREDNYVPKENPVESPNTIDPNVLELEKAARSAKNAEPFLILRGHVANVRSVSFSPDGKLIASGSEDKTVKVWDAATGTILRSLRGHSSSVTSVFFSPDGKTLISSGKDKTVRVWDAATGEAIQRSAGISCEGTPAAFSPDGKFLATTDKRNINIVKTQRK